MKSIVALLRHQQYVAEEMVITLADELKFVDDYVTVEQDAIEGETIYEVVVNDGIDPSRVWIPSMFLQILAENAFKHGFRHILSRVSEAFAHRRAALGRSHRDNRQQQFPATHG